MSFLNPLFLLALSAVCVPLLIHIFSRRRVPEVPFPTIRFIKPSDRRSMRRINLRRLFLLMLRMAGVALVALAFARPVARGRLASLFPPGGSRAACVLLDGSYSMRVEGSGGTAFERAKSRLRGVLENLGDDDEVALLLFDTSVTKIYEAGRLEREVLRSTLEGAGPGWAGTNLRGAVEEGRRWLGSSRREVREIYIISDFQESSVGSSGKSGGVDEGERGEAPAETPVRAYLLPVTPEPGVNVAVEDLLTPRTTLHSGELVRVEVLLRNTSEELEARFPLRLLIGGRRIIEKELEMPPGVVARENLLFPAERTGWIRGEVRKKADRLGADDRRFFALDVSGRLNVLLISDRSGLYLSQALMPEGYEGDISLDWKGWNEYTTADLDRAATLVLAAGGGLRGEDSELVERFVSAGGKAVVMVVPELEVLVRSLSRYDPSLEFVEFTDGFMSIAEPPAVPDFLSPFSGDDIEALSGYRFRNTARVGGVPDRAVHLRFKTGGPFIWEEKRGGGVLLFVVMDPRPESCDIVLSPHFLPLVQQAVLAAGSRGAASSGNLIGEPVEFFPRSGAEVTCRLPDGTEFKPAGAGGEAVPRDSGPGAGGTGREGMVIPAVEEPGFLTLFEDSDTAAVVAVNPDCRGESDLRSMPPEEVADSLGLSHFAVVEEGEEITAAVTLAREGREITLLLLVAAAAAFLLEVVIAQAGKGGGGV